jgi:hypothetical protein
LLGCERPTRFHKPAIHHGVVPEQFNEEVHTRQRTARGPGAAASILSAPLARSTRDLDVHTREI